jgi:multicomponent K+:H+ antiporter subunit E
LDVKSELTISLLANTVSLTPGTVSLEVSPDRRFLRVHALDARDPAAMQTEIKQRYEAPLQRVFES